MKPGNLSTLRQLQRRIHLRHDVFNNDAVMNGVDYWRYFFEKDERKNAREGQEQIIAEYVGWA